MGRRSLTFCCCLLAVPTCCKLMAPFIRADSLEISVMAGAILGLCYLFVRPVMKILSIPIGCLTFGTFNLVIDAGLFLLLPKVVPGFYVESFLWALIAGFMVNALCLTVGGVKQG